MPEQQNAQPANDNIRDQPDPRYHPMVALRELASSKSNQDPRVHRPLIARRVSGGADIHTKVGREGCTTDLQNARLHFGVVVLGLSGVQPDRPEKRMW